MFDFSRQVFILFISPKYAVLERAEINGFCWQFSHLSAFSLIAKMKDRLLKGPTV